MAPTRLLISAGDSSSLRSHGMTEGGQPRNDEGAAPSPPAGSPLSRRVRLQAGEGSKVLVRAVLLAARHFGFLRRGCAVRNDSKGAPRNDSKGAATE